MTRKKADANDSIGTLDFETDPFLIGRVPFPFAAGIYFSQNDHVVLWESDSKTDFIARVIRALRRLPECTLYAHNGGRFDFHYLLEYANAGTIEIRNGRVTKFRIGKVTLKDSFPLMPFALAEFRKTPIDYTIFERNKRNAPRNRERIEAYLLDDCRDLLELVTGFRSIVGAKDTIGAAAFHQMRDMGLNIQHMSEQHDSMFRPFYFGGRVQAFEGGLLNGPFEYLDINSAYPFAMLNRHAHGGEYQHCSRLPKRLEGTEFVRCIATSRGALPMRDANGSLAFPHIEAEFYATGWEIKAGQDTGALDVHKILDCWKPKSFICFRDYVETFYAKRLTAKKASDKIGALAYKYLLNSGYGKFAQNPRDFKEYRLAPYGKMVSGFDWETDFGAVSLWSRPSYREWGFYDVATSASICGFVRAMLWRAIAATNRVIYVDTDAMLCKSAPGIERGEKLGQWKLEGKVKRAAIAGKKLYGVEWASPQDGQAHKIASKGARLSWSDMLQLCKGRSIIWENDAPTFSISGAHFVRRRIAATI